MSITIPDRTLIRITTDFLTPMNGHSLPNMVANVAITNPGPIAIDPVNGTVNGQVQAIQAAGSAGANGYVGYNIDPNIPAGGPVSPIRQAIVDGFAGVVAGNAVYIDATSADASGTASGLTHTQPQTASGNVTAEFDAGTVSATTVIEVVVPAGATLLTAFDLTVNTTVAADDTNYWTQALANLGNSSAAMLAVLDTNTSKATGGNGGYAAGVPTAAILTGTGANLVVSGGQVLRLTMTKASSAANLVDLTVRAVFSGPIAGQGKIGVGWTTTKILFH